MSCVLTLALDDEAQSRFENERQQHFPPALNRIPAHLSLFHTLAEEEATFATLHLAAELRSAFPMQVTELRSLGKGVAYFLQSSAAKSLHRDLSEAFADQLSPQDRQGFRPHVVVQNKVTPEVAKVTRMQLQARFQPWTVTAVGLDLWRYLGGPWLHLQRFEFGPSDV
ncbi:MAG: 2'-5' RNA ligase family protein [Janthinobacterium lividum]